MAGIVLTSHVRSFNSCQQDIYHKIHKPKDVWSVGEHNPLELSFTIIHIGEGVANNDSGVHIHIFLFKAVKRNYTDRRRIILVFTIPTNVSGRLTSRRIFNASLNGFVLRLLRGL